MKMGWIGLGAMGGPMAGHVHAAGLLAAVWNRSADKSAAFADAHDGVGVADDPAALAAGVDVIAICVSADEDLRGVIAALGPGLRAGQVVVDHSTVAPETARDIATELNAMDVAFVDAPVTGGVEGARDGRLMIMAGGDANAFARLAPAFEAYGRLAKHLGPAGSGQAAKAVNQLMVAGIAEAVCEALALMERLGLPADDMRELLGGGAAGNWFLEKRGATMLADSFDTGFDPRLLYKDLKICRRVCAEAGFDSAVIDQALADYGQLLKRFDPPGRDISALIRLKRAGPET